MIGLSLLLYPTLSEYWNSIHQTRAVDSYNETVRNIDDDTYQSIWEDAVAYNEALTRKGNRFALSEEELKDYESQLNVTGTGMMGYIEIDQIDCRLPIYHGTDAEVLQIAVGHIEGSSLPVGGENTHCVLSGHRGLPSAKLFTELDRLAEGDLFVIYTLDTILTYEVDQIRIVLPDEVDELQIVEGEDLCTLVTCTPYGVNSHRLLVRGHRVANRSGAGVDMDAIQIDPVIAASVVAVPVLLVLFVWLLVTTRKKKSKR